MSRWSAVVAVAVGTTLVLAPPAAANTVTINDEANVLDVTRVQNDAARLPVSIYVWTTTEDVSRSAFDAAAGEKASGRTPLVLGINLKTHDKVLAGVRRVGLDQAEAVDAVGEFDYTLSERRFIWDRNDATDGVEAVLNSLESSLTGQGSTRSHRGLHGPVDWIVFPLICVVLALICIGRFIGVIHLVRRKPQVRRDHKPPPGSHG
jgi:hypothetical protein